MLKPFSALVMTAALFCLSPLAVFAQQASSVTASPNIASLMPRHGTVSTTVPGHWEDYLAAGNGIMGGMLAGDPQHDMLVADHCELWLPAGSREILPKMGPYIPQLRDTIGAKGYDAGQGFYNQKAGDQGWGGLIWTDKFHPGFNLSIDQAQSGGVTDYARVENFETGDTWAQWHSGDGDFKRTMFVSKADNVIVSRTTGPAGKVSLTLTMAPDANDAIKSVIVHQPGLITRHAVYVNGKGGYDAAVRIVADGGTQTSDGKSVTIQNSNAVTLIMRIQPWKTPLPATQSEAWEYSASNPDFSAPGEVAGPYRAAAAYNPHWMSDLTGQLNTLPSSYDKLLTAHIAAWSPIFDRVSINLDADPADRKLSSEAILDQAKTEQKMSPALLERMYDAGRYVYMCCAGPYTPPNLFGIWTNTWSPAWSGDFTTDTNLELDVQCAESANMPELMGGYFRLWDSYIPDFKTTAMDLYGCRGIMTGMRASNIGLGLHWGGGWPGYMWTCGAGWIAHFYYDHYLYTGDKVFLRKEAIPFMEQTALFYEDFLKGTEDANGHYTFRPDYSAENGWGDDCSQDIEISHEVLTNLIDGCATLGIEQDKIPHWKALLAKMPPLLINGEGQLKEWSNPSQGENNNHRHLMHLYGAFESQQFTPDGDPALFAAARVALMNRVNASQETATHGYMQTGLASAQLGFGNIAYARIEQLAKHRSINLSFVDSHNPNGDILCDDGNGTTPDIVNRMVIQSKPGLLALLPAVPDALPQGTLSGTMARGAILVNRIHWDTAAGTLAAMVTSKDAQTIALIMPPNATVSKLTINGKSQTVVSIRNSEMGCMVHLPKGKLVTISAVYHANAAATTSASAK